MYREVTITERPEVAKQRVAALRARGVLKGMWWNEPPTLPDGRVSLTAIVLVNGTRSGPQVPRPRYGDVPPPLVRQPRRWRRVAVISGAAVVVLAGAIAAAIWALTPVVEAAIPHTRAIVTAVGLIAFAYVYLAFARGRRS